MKNYMSFIRDHSGSMAHLGSAAMRDYNDTIIATREAAIEHYQDTIVSVIRCGGRSATAAPSSPLWGRGGVVNVDAILSSVTFLRPLTEYRVDGQTPLFDSVGKAIEIFEKVPDADDPSVSFVVMAVTDGQENASTNYTARTLAAKIKQLQATDRWTFAFRVPKGHKSILTNLGIPEWNVMEWDTTEQGMRESSVQTQTAVKTFFKARAGGQSSSKRFFADLSTVSSADVKANMKDISSEVLMFPISTSDHRKEIKPFIESKLKGSIYLKGAAFYQLAKPEDIQDHKRLMIRDKTSNAIYEGLAARQMLGFPTMGQVRAHPGSLGNFDLFIQSTSLNRKVDAGTNVVYWTGAVR